MHLQGREHFTEKWSCTSKLFLPILPDINMSRFDIFFPLVFRSGAKHLSPLEHIDCSKIVWKCTPMFYTAACCSLVNVIMSRLTASVGLRKLPNYTPCQHSLNSQQSMVSVLCAKCCCTNSLRATRNQLNIRAKTISYVYLASTTLPPCLTLVTLFLIR
jgi:hypothetical protein